MLRGSKTRTNNHKYASSHYVDKPLVHRKTSMFSAPPTDWIEECRREWLERQKKTEQSPSIGKSNAEANTSTERVCFFNDEEAQPVQTRKKHIPAEGLSFF